MSELLSGAFKALGKGPSPEEVAKVAELVAGEPLAREAAYGGPSLEDLAVIASVNGSGPLVALDLATEVARIIER